MSTGYHSSPPFEVWYRPPARAPTNAVPSSSNRGESATQIVNGLVRPLLAGCQLLPPSFDRYTPAIVAASTVLSFVKFGESARPVTVPPSRFPRSCQLFALVATLTGSSPRRSSNASEAPVPPS